MRLETGLSAWSRSCPLPIALLMDEFDALSGRALISVLRQPSAGPNDASVLLYGMQSIGDYKAASLWHLYDCR